MSKVQQVYREVRKYLSKEEARAFAIGIVAKPWLLDCRCQITEPEPPQVAPVVVPKSPRTQKAVVR